MVDMAALKAENAERWTVARITRNGFHAVARSLTGIQAKAQYQTVSRYTGVPWWVIAVIHERESAQNWKANLAQGDPWNKVSVHVPKGRGPFESWVTAAIDALMNCSPYAAKNHDWSVGGTLTLLEEYNGLGYAAHGIPSPYIWAGTNQYVKGKFIRDGVFSPDEVDPQLGCAGILKAMMELDETIHFGQNIIPLPLSHKPKVVVSSTSAPVPGFFTKAFNFLFGRR